jgi:mannonate dehydratase
VHERVSPHQAVQFARDLEPIRLFYLEDVLPPERIEYFRQVRQQCATSLAMGELFDNPHERQPLISERLIDYIRMHLSQAGGLTRARKIAILAEQFGVKTAWHGPGDVSPVGHIAQLHVDLASYNFGIQEDGVIQGLEAEILKGCSAYKMAICGPAMRLAGRLKWMNSAPLNILSVRDPTISTVAVK